MFHNSIVYLMFLPLPQLLDQFQVYTSDLDQQKEESFTLGRPVVNGSRLKGLALLNLIGICFWLMVFFLVAMHASVFPVWAILLCLVVMFVVPAGALLALLLIYIFREERRRKAHVKS
jgi:hypothetical protein